MPLELYNQDDHLCVMLHDLARDEDEAVQSNQFLIIDADHAALLEPGGVMTYNEMLLAVGRYAHLPKLEYLVASHADPDIIAALDRLMTAAPATKLVISRIWERFVPHFCKFGKTTDRVVGIPDSGGRLRLGRSELWLLPAHFLHAEGNFQFYDPKSRILFSGDLGASLCSGDTAGRIVTDLKPHLPRMEGFHRRYMVANKILRLWANMVRSLDIAMIVPQHGAPMAGPAVGQFIAWVEQLSCGIDLFGQDHYRVPMEPLALR
jgi:flavorubredoxin